MDSPEIGVRRGRGLGVPQNNRLAELFVLTYLGTWRPGQPSSDVWDPSS